MKKAEIAEMVFAHVEKMPLTAVAGGPLQTRVTELSALSMVPWFCEVSVQWAVRLTNPSGAFKKKNAIPKVPNTYVAIDADGRLLVGVPGDGIDPGTYTLTPLCEAIAAAAPPGSTLELAAANMGTVKRDYDAKADSLTPHGNQRYVGTIGDAGAWTIDRSTTGASSEQIDTALDCARRFLSRGPWDVKDKAEARSILKIWLASPQANINPAAVKAMLTMRGLQFEDTGVIVNGQRVSGLDRKLYGLALGFFRHRLAGGPFRWDEPLAWGFSEAECEDVLKAIVQ